MTLNLKDFSLVSARPTCGKTTLIVNDDDSLIMDTDFLTFKLLEHWMDPVDFKEFMAGHNMATKARNFKRIIERYHMFWMQFDTGMTWITNLMPDPEIVKACAEHGKTMWVTRDPDDAWRLYQERSEKLGKPLKLKEKDVRRWMEIPDWTDIYDEVVVLESGEYLCDTFGIVPSIIAADDVDRAFQDQCRANFIVPELRDGGRIWE